MSLNFGNANSSWQVLPFRVFISITSSSRKIPCFLMSLNSALLLVLPMVCSPVFWPQLLFSHTLNPHWFDVARIMCISKNHHECVKGSRCEPAHIQVLVEVKQRCISWEKIIEEDCCHLTFLTLGGKSLDN